MVMVLRKPRTPEEAFYYKAFDGKCEVDYPDTLKQNVDFVRSRLDEEASEVSQFYFRYFLLDKVEIVRLEKTARVMWMEIRVVKNAVARIKSACSVGANMWILMHGHTFNSNDMIKYPKSDVRYLDVPNRVGQLLCRRGITTIEDLRDSRSTVRKHETIDTYRCIEKACIEAGIWVE